MKEKTAKGEPSHVGLCFDCLYVKQIEAREDTFFLCERSFADCTFPKYPRLPLLRPVNFFALQISAAQNKKSESYFRSAPTDTGFFSAFIFWSEHAPSVELKKLPEIHLDS